MSACMLVGRISFLLCAVMSSGAQASQMAPVYQAQAGSVASPRPPQQVEKNSPPRNQNNTNNSSPFEEYYPRQNTQLFKDSASFYFQAGGTKLVKRNISQDHLKKAVVVFFGDWCPHCDSFLRALAPHIEILRLSGITTIFVGIPSIEELKHWKGLTVDHFNEAENKIASYNIKLATNKTFVTMIGDKSVLATCGIEGLPVFVAVKNGKEKCRFVGEKAVQKINISDPNVLKQFLAIWDDDAKNPQMETTELQSDGDQTILRTGDLGMDEKTADSEKTQTQKRSKKQKRSRGKKYSFECFCPSGIAGGKRKVDWKKARDITEQLNKFDYSKLRQPGLLFYD